VDADTFRGGSDEGKSGPSDGEEGEDQSRTHDCGTTGLTGAPCLVVDQHDQGVSRKYGVWTPKRR
jgi:hypothetical protein